MDPGLTGKGMLQPSQMILCDDVVTANSNFLCVGHQLIHERCVESEGFLKIPNKEPSLDAR